MFMIYPLLIISNIIIFSKSDKLIFAGIHFRHGARGPIKLGNEGKDLLGADWSATGELTPVGQKMHYLLGLRNRQRYITEYKLLSEKFDPHELVVYSSDLNRTLLSVTSQIQGLYPINSTNGDVLDQDQLEKAVPPVNITFDNISEVSEAQKSLNISALPNNMTIIPIHLIDFLIDNSDECTTKINNMRNKNDRKKESIVNFVKAFKANYSEGLEKFYQNKIVTDLNFTIIAAICDATVADHIEKKNVTEFFNKSNINQEDFINSCYEALKINFRDKLFSDENNELLLFFNSYIIEKIIHYMKQRINDDINGDISRTNASDYSSPKMLILSGHDTTLTAQELFFIKFFNYDLETYIFPTYASQTVFEITRKEVDEISRKNLNYSDYTLCHYFNDKLVFNMTFDIFMEKMGKINLWNKDNINKFCYGEKPILTTNLIIIISMGALALILIIIIIILICKIKNQKDEYLIDEHDNGSNGKCCITPEEDK